MKLSAAGALGAGVSGWFADFARAAAPMPQRKRSCILLWMSGGPSTIDLWDLKPGHANGGSFKPIATTVPGIKIGEHLPKLAKQMKRLAIVRSMSTKEADHSRATYLMHTGRAPGGPIQYPTLGSLVSKELDGGTLDLPGFVAVGAERALNGAAWAPGFLGPRYAPLVVAENQGFVGGQANSIDSMLRVQDLDSPKDVSRSRADARLDVLAEMEDEFLQSRSSPAASSHRTAYLRAVKMMRSPAMKAFELDREPAKLRDKYGRNLFGQGCLLARRLIEQGVPFVEVNLGGWDTHQDNFNAVKRQCDVLDPGWATLLEDLDDKGLLASTTIVWMGEFGRTPKINGGKGRDHWSASWSAVLAGGGVKGGTAYGKTSADGMEVTSDLVRTPDFLATIGKALGLDVSKQNNSNVGRPIRFVDPEAKAVKEVLL
jgi:hypothetical protein